MKALLTERKLYVRTRASMLARKDAMEQYETKEGRKRREDAVKKLTDCITSLELQMEPLSWKARIGTGRIG